MKDFHQPVLLQEVIDYLKIQKGKKYLDATVGDGGHSLAILKNGGRILGIDCDPEAIKVARRRLSQACPSRPSVSSRDVGTSASWRLAQANFADLKKIAKKEGFYPADGVLLDLGASTRQLTGGGFSFHSSAPLDMRMDPGLQVTAADLVNGLNKGELNELFYKLAQEKYSRPLANALVRARRVRPIKTCQDLANLVARVKKARGRQKVHPATKVFQALRIAVNDELNNLRKALPQAVAILKPRGRLAVISFHSGEDKIVKEFFLKAAEEESVVVITKKPIRPSLEEVRENPASRSAKLRVAEKR